MGVAGVLAGAWWDALEPKWANDSVCPAAASLVNVRRIARTPHSTSKAARTAVAAAVSATGTQTRDAHRHVTPTWLVSDSGSRRAGSRNT